MRTFVQDLHAAVRSFRTNPGLALAVVVTLGLGIGANTSMFSVVSAVLLRPLPYRAPAELVRVWPQFTWSKAWLSDVREQTDSFSAVSGYAGIELTLTGGSQSVIVEGVRASWNHFGLLGVRPALGRPFVSDDALPGAAGVVVLSHGLWQRQFGGDPNLVGQSIELEGDGFGSRTVVGIMSERYRSLLDSQGRRQFWIPLQIDAADERRYFSRYLRAVARVNDSAALESASADVRQFASILQARFPNFVRIEETTSAGVIPLHGAMVGDVRPATLMLLGAVALVLLLGCANVANLLLARAEAREREVAIRRALGATTFRIVRFVMTESLLLGALGGGLGLLIALWMLDVFVARLPADFPRTAGIGIDTWVLGFTASISVLASLLAGTLPAMRATGAAVCDSLRHGGRGSTAGRSRTRHGLVMLEVAVAMVLVVGATLMLRSLWQLGQVDPGFEPDGVVVLALHPSPSRFPEAAQRVAYYDEITERLRANPEILAVGATQLLPLGDSNWSTTYARADQPIADGVALPTANRRIVTPGYFRALAIPLIEGRAPTAFDRDGAPGVGWINERLARILWPDQTAVGKRMRAGSDEVTVVGVVGNVRQQQLDLESAPAIYRPHAQTPQLDMFVVARMTGDPDRNLRSVQQVIWSVDERVPVTEAGSMSDVIAASVGQSRFVASILSTFAVAALLLGLVGVYGVVAYSVGSRRAEIAVRMAMGATSRAVMALVLGRTAATIAIGIGVGVVVGLAAARVLSSMLFDVSATDVTTFVVVGALVAATSAMAAVLPAMRATRVDPATMLRGD